MADAPGWEAVRWRLVYESSEPLALFPIEGAVLVQEDRTLSVIHGGALRRLEGALPEGVRSARARLAAFGRWPDRAHFVVGRSCCHCAPPVAEVYRWDHPADRWVFDAPLSRTAGSFFDVGGGRAVVQTEPDPDGSMEAEPWVVPAPPGPTWVEQLQARCPVLRLWEVRVLPTAAVATAWCSAQPSDGRDSLLVVAEGGRVDLFTFEPPTDGSPVLRDAVELPSGERLLAISNGHAASICRLEGTACVQEPSREGRFEFTGLVTLRGDAVGVGHQVVEQGGGPWRILHRRAAGRWDEVPLPVGDTAEPKAIAVEDGVLWAVAERAGPDARWLLYASIP